MQLYIFKTKSGPIIFVTKYYLGGCITLTSCQFADISISYRQILTKNVHE